MYGVYLWPIDLYIVPNTPTKIPRFEASPDVSKFVSNFGDPNAMDPSGWEVSKVDRSKLKVGFP